MCDKKHVAIIFFSFTGIQRYREVTDESKVWNSKTSTLFAFLFVGLAILLCSAVGMSTSRAQEDEIQKQTALIKVKDTIAPYPTPTLPLLRTVMNKLYGFRFSYPMQWKYIESNYRGYSNSYSLYNNSIENRNNIYKQSTRKERQRR